MSNTYYSAARLRYSNNAYQSLFQGSSLRMIAFIAAHIPLALSMYQIRMIAMLHVLLTVSLGLRWASRDRRFERVAYVGAYIVGSEVLWRMSRAPIFWEFGKYALAFIFIVAAFRMGNWKNLSLPLLYFAALLPSTVLTLFYPDLVLARKYISFNLSGPFALTASIWFFSQLRLSQEQLHRLMVILISPVVGVAAITLFSTFTATSLKFTGESNFVTSGGFGPNQVSAVLGLGALAAFFYLLSNHTERALNGLVFLSMIGMATQSAMTFSRGGLYNAAFGMLLASLVLAKEARARNRLMLVLGCTLLLAIYVVMPRLNQFTGGALAGRFQSTGLSNRDTIAKDDLNLWMENPVFGVGPGMARFSRDSSMTPTAAHTEFTRLLGEHGIFGLAAILLLLSLGVLHFKRATSDTHKALILSFLGWSTFFMLNSGMRLAAPAFAFGLTAICLVPDPHLILSRPRTYPSSHPAVSSSPQ